MTEPVEVIIRISLARSAAEGPGISKLSPAEGQACDESSEEWA